MHLSIDIKYSMVEIMISLLMLEWYFWLPYRRVSCVSLWDKVLSSMFLIFWKRVYLGMGKLIHCWERKKYIGDSTSLPHLHKWFKVSWKQCLNLCSWRWLRPRRNLIKSLIPRGLWISKILLARDRMRFRSFFLKYWGLLSF